MAYYFLSFSSNYKVQVAGHGRLQKDPTTGDCSKTIFA